MKSESIKYNFKHTQNGKKSLKYHVYGRIYLTILWSLVIGQKKIIKAILFKTSHELVFPFFVAKFSFKKYYYLDLQLYESNIIC